MKVVLLVCLALVPFVMGGSENMVEHMMKYMHEAAKKNGWGEMDKSKGKGGDDDSGEKDDVEGMKKMMKEWGMEVGEWSEKMEGWSEKMKGSDDDDHDDDKKEEKHKEMYNDFKEFLKGKEEERKMMEEKKEYFQKNIFQFKKYMQLQMMKQHENKSKEMFKEKGQKMDQMSHMLEAKLKNMSGDFMDAKFHMMVANTVHLLDLCQCDDSTELLMRLKDGRFGKVDEDNNSGNGTGGNRTGGNGPSGNGTRGNGTRPDGGSTHVGNSTGSGGNQTQSHENENDPKNQEEMKYMIKTFAAKGPEEKFKYALHKLVKHMCSSATVYMEHLMEVEEMIQSLSI